MSIATKGFSLPEILLAAIILALLAGSGFMAISSSNNHAMNACNQILEEQIAREALEVFRSIGFNRLSECHESVIAGYQLNTWQPVATFSRETGIERPAACSMFARKISMQLLEKDGINAIMLRVSVRLQKNALINGNESTFSTILVEQQ